MVYNLFMKSVYLIRGNNGKYKIGIAKNPEKRLSQLQTGNSDDLKLIETYKSDNARKIETILHNHYMCEKERGEWFNLSITEEVSFIKKCMNIDNNICTLKKMGNKFI